MSNYQSYQSQQVVDAPVQNAGVQIRDGVQTHRATITDGVLISTTAGDHGQARIAELNPFHGTDTWQATAQHPRGLPVVQIEASTLVKIGGVQARVQDFVTSGVLQKNPDGSFSESTGQPQQAEQVPEGFMPVHPEAMAVINGAIEPLPDYALDSITAHGIATAVGKFDEASLTAAFSKATGLDPADAGQRMGAAKALYSAHANHAIQVKAGIDGDDADEFWQWCRTNHAGQLSDAIGKQLRQHDVSGYVALAERWKSSTAPTVHALQAAGIPTRMVGGVASIWIGGVWMTPTAAAKAGLV